MLTVDFAKLGHLLTFQHTGVAVGKEARLLEYHSAHVDKVVGHGWVSKLLKVSPGHSVHVFRLLTEAEESFLASRFPTCPGHGENLVGGHGLGVWVPGALDECAVAAAVSAEVGQGDENLAGVGDAPPLGLFGGPGGACEKCGNLCALSSDQPVCLFSG